MGLGSPAIRALSNLAAALCLALAAAAPAGATPGPVWNYVSAPTLHPPRLQVVERSAGLAKGDFLAANLLPSLAGHPPAGQRGLLLLDSRAQPLWFMPTKGNVYAFGQQTYMGKPVLVWLAGQTLVMADEHYRKIATIRAQPPWAIDIHDSYIADGDVWVTVFRIVSNQNLTRYGGHRHAHVLDEGLEEFQISTGKVVSTWDALNPGGTPNVPLSASEVSAKTTTQLTPNGPKLWDPYHLNSVQALPNGDLLVSMRNTWAVYLIDPTTDRTIWTLGGKHSTFQSASGASFAWQHDARLVDPAQGGHGRNIKLTLFNDDNGGVSTQNPSEGMVLALSTTTDQAMLVSAYRHNPPLAAPILGSMQLLANGNALVGWGGQPYFSEYSPSGKELLDVRWPGASLSYRVLLTNAWVGAPSDLPSGAVRGDNVYASWNGATRVARWEVLAGSNTGHLAVVATARRTGFETAITLTRSFASYEVRALSASGTALGTSDPFS